MFITMCELRGLVIEAFDRLISLKTIAYQS